MALAIASDNSTNSNRRINGGDFRFVRYDPRKFNLAMTTPTATNSPERIAPPRTIGFFTACGIVIANIIGTGVFTSLGFQLPQIHSGFALIMLWIVGGIAA